MKHTRLTALLLAALLLFTTACGGGTTPAEQEDDTLNILATTYPIYLFASSVAEGASDVEVTLLVNEAVSCLHDYTLTVNDMKAIEQADVILINGVGLEDFMDDALAQSSAAVIDCSEGIELLPATGHHDHDHGHEDEGEHYDPHIWLDPARAAQMVENISTGLTQLNSYNAELYAENAAAAVEVLDNLSAPIGQLGTQRALLSTELITFHDGFQYFADAYGLSLLKAIEEEEGAEASAAEIKEIVALIEEHHIPAIFTEVNGSDSTAQAIARETGVDVGQLTMIMSGEGSDMEAYQTAMRDNMREVLYLLSGKQASIP